MDRFGNAFKAVVIVMGGLALLGLIVILSPLIAGIFGVLLGLLEFFLPVIIVLVLIAVVYVYLTRDKH